MKNLIKNSNKKFFHTILFFLAVTPFLTIAFLWGGEFLENCPNKKHIGWDPVSRFQVSLEFADWIRNYHFHKIILGLIDAPTWPALRSILEAIGILLIGPSTILSIGIGYLVFIFTGISLSYIVLQEFQSKLSMIPVFFLIIIGGLWLYQIQPYHTYIFSGMLEIQGGLFLLWTIYFLKNYSNKNKVFLIISYILLLQTKYPYAILFNVSLIIYILLFSKYWKPKNLKWLLFSYLDHTKQVPILSFSIIPLSIYLLGKLSYIPLPGKSSIYLIYSLFLLLMLDASLFFFFYIRNQLKSKLVFLSYIVLGGFWYIGIHPDRFSSTFSTIKHTQIEGHGYFQQLSNDIFLVIPLLSIIILFYFFKYSKKVLYLFKNKYKTLIFIPIDVFIFIYKKNPYLWISFFIILVQSIFTENRQTRHIYHVYPVLILGTIIFLIEFKKSIITTYLMVGTLFFILSIKTITLKPNLCYAGKNLDVRELPDFIREQASKNIQSSIILINDINPTHINKPDSEIQIYIECFKKKFKIYKYPRYPKFKENLSIVRISENCNSNLLERYIHSYLNNIETLVQQGWTVLEIQNPNGIGCWEQVEFFHNELNK